MDQVEGRADRKKREVRERIVAAAADLILKRGARAVSLDDVAERAEVARRTLFNYFESKDDLVFATTEPVLLASIELAETFANASGSTIDDAIAFCLALWRRCGRSLGLIYSVGLDESERLAELHGRFQEVFRGLIARAVAGEPAGRARLVGKLVYRSFVPLLLALEGEENADERFMSGLRGLIAGASGAVG